MQDLTPTQDEHQLHTLVQPSTVAITQKKTSYDFSYQYNPSGLTSVRPHAPIHIGDRTYSYDANGNQTGWTADTNGTNRTIIWNEENRIESISDQGHTKTYKYDDQGNRVIKRGPQGETVYVNQFHTQRPGATGTKHVYAGTSRIVSKLVKQDTPGANPQGNTPFEKDLYFYHPDHLGTSNYITDTNGKLYEHLEYFPFGESWVEENSNTQRTPFLFTAKELDEETGLYYFGARYYDPRTSVWQSGDPVLGKYLNGAAGGVYESSNLALYTYGRNNPIIFKDPDGNIVPIVMAAIWAGGAAITAYDTYQTYKQEGAKGAAIALGKDAAITAATGGAAKVALKFVPDSVKRSASNWVGDKIGSLFKRGNDGVDLKLKHKSDWTDAQRQAACEKCQALTEADTVVTKNAERSGTSAAERYNRAGGDVPQGKDVDHIQDLQLGGADDVLNMAPLDRSVNRSIGAQIQQQIKDLPEGTRVNKVTIE